MEKQKFVAKKLCLKSVIANIIDSNMAGGRKQVKKGSTAAKQKKGKNVKKSTRAVATDGEEAKTVEDDAASVVTESQSHSSPTHSTYNTLSTGGRFSSGGQL